MEIIASDSKRIAWTERWPALLRHPLAACLVFAIVSLLIYAPALSGELIWDDDYLVGQNPFFKSPVFIFEVFRHYLFSESFSIYYRPVQNWTYMLDYWVWGGNPYGYHLTNILFHAGSGCLLHRLLRTILPGLIGGPPRLKVSESAAFLVSLLWIVHPVHNAAVAYISGRADSIASFFALSAWLLFLRAKKGTGIRKGTLAALAAVSILLALCAKEIALVWLLIFLLYVIFFSEGESWRSKVVVLGGLAVIFGLYLVLHSLPAHRIPMENGDPSPFTIRLLLALRAMGDYTGLIFFPARLMMDRTLTSPARDGSSPSWYASIGYEYLSLLGLTALVACAILCRRKGTGQKLRVFGALWFLIAFLPISNLFPLNAEVAEHWIYLASMGYLAFLAGCVLFFTPRWQQVAASTAIVAAALLGARTARRAADWSDPVTFYARTIEDGGGTARIYGNLASAFARRGDLGRQEAILRRTLQLFPEFIPARINLGVCLVNQNRPAEAELFLDFAKPVAEEVSHHFPRTWSAALNLARVRAETGQPEEALTILAEAKSRSPETWELVKGEADLLERKQRAGAAIPAVAEYAAAHWWHEDAWMTLGHLRATAGDPQGAINAMLHASRLDIHDPKPFANIARLELSRNHPEAACEAQQAAIRRDPNQPSRHLVLAAILDRLGRKEEAAIATQNAVQLKASLALGDS